MSGHSLYAHGGNGVQRCVARCKEVVLVLAHFDGVQPVSDRDEERVVRHVLWGVGEAKMQMEIYTLDSCAFKAVLSAAQMVTRSGVALRASKIVCYHNRGFC